MIQDTLVVPQTGLGIAEAFTLLSLEWPVSINPLVAWSDADFALAGAHLMDLSFQGKVDSDIDGLMILEPAAAAEDQPLALRILHRFGPRTRLDTALDALVGRVGDLRSATLGALAGRNIEIVTTKPLSWNFHQAAFSNPRLRESALLRASLTHLVESGELPDPEQAALISLLHACEIAGPVLGGSNHGKWLARHGERIDAIRRLDLVGRAVVEVIAHMRSRLRTYLLDAGEKPAALDKPKKRAPAPKAIDYVRSDTTWEWRAFWAEGDIIELPAIWGHLGEGAGAVEEENEDRYLFVHGKKDNIKFRGSGLKIKPVVEAFDDFIAFAPSEKFGFPQNAALLSKIFPRFYEVRGKVRSTDELLNVLSATGYRPNTLTVSKSRRAYCMIFGVQVEFARISVQGRIFHSVSLESPYLTALRIVARNIPIGRGRAMGYSEFLEDAAKNVV